MNKQISKAEYRSQIRQRFLAVDTSNVMDALDVIGRPPSGTARAPSWMEGSEMCAGFLLGDEEGLLVIPVDCLDEILAKAEEPRGTGQPLNSPWSAPTRSIANKVRMGKALRPKPKERFSGART